jgi:hypothetical protein
MAEPINDEQEPTLAGLGQDIPDEAETDVTQPEDQQADASTDTQTDTQPDAQPQDQGYVGQVLSSTDYSKIGYTVDPHTKVIHYANGVDYLPTGFAAIPFPDGHAIVDPNSGKIVHFSKKEGGDPESILEKKAAEKGILKKDFMDEKGNFDEKSYRKAYSASVQGGDAESIAEGVMNGVIDPSLKGLFRSKPYVLSILAKHGYDQKTAALDYYGMQRYISTANSTPIFKLRSSAETAYHSLDLVDEFAKQWKANAHMPALNKANLIAAKNGAYGKDAAALANKLDGQITDLQSEIAVVNQGGGVPSIPALENASHLLRSDWDESTLLQMTDLSRRNLQIRLNSLKSIGPADLGSYNSKPEDTKPETTPKDVPVTSDPTRAAAERTLADPTKSEAEKAIARAILSH